MKKSVRRILFIDQRTSIAISMGDDRMGQPTCTKKFRINLESDVKLYPLPNTPKQSKESQLRMGKAK